MHFLSVVNVASFANQSDQHRSSQLLHKALAIIFLAATSQLLPISLPESHPPSKSNDISSWSQPKVLQAQKFSWVTGDDQAPVVETKRLEDIHGVRVRMALHTLAAMGPDDPKKNKYMKIMDGGRDAPIHPTVREIAQDLRI